MSITLIDTPASVNANTYASLAFALAYFDLRFPYAGDWDTADAERKKAVLYWATKLLDDEFTWNGGRATRDQALGWPRVGVVDRDGWEYDSNEIPKELQRAVCELALNLLGSNTTNPSALAGIKSVTLGPISVTADRLDPKTALVIDDRITRSIEHLGRQRRLSITAQLVRV